MKNRQWNTYTFERDYSEETTVIDVVPYRLDEPIYIPPRYTAVVQEEVMEPLKTKDNLESLTKLVYQYIIPTMIGVGIGVSSILTGAGIIILPLRAGAL